MKLMSPRGQTRVWAWTKSEKTAVRPKEELPDWQDVLWCHWWAWLRAVCAVVAAPGLASCGALGNGVALWGPQFPQL